MSSTPNYGYNKCLEVFDYIDRDMKRIEDKADQTAIDLREKSDQILTNQSKIDCLGGKIDRAQADIADRYTKDETDCKLAAKADRCAFKKHLMDPHAHEDLFDGKVDKQEGCRLFCEGDQQRLDDIEEELGNKADKGQLESYMLPLLDGYKNFDESGIYIKNDNNLVIVTFNITHSDTRFPTGSSIAIAQVPEGFRPNTIYHTVGAGLRQSDGMSTAGIGIWIVNDGRLLINNYFDDLVRLGCTLIYYAQ